MEIREPRDQARNVSACGLDFDGDRNGVLVVFNHEDDRQFLVGGGVKGFPEFAFAGGAVAQGNVGDFVAAERDVFEFAVVAFGFLGRVWMVPQVDAGFGAADCLQDLRACGRRLGDDVQPVVGPVRRHLASAGTRIIGGAHGLEQHFVRSGTQGEDEGTVPIIRIEPVVRRLEAKGGGDADGFVTGSRDLEKDLLLAFEQDFAVVHPAGRVHRPIGINELLAGEARIGLGLLVFDGLQLGISFRRRHSVPYWAGGFAWCIVNADGEIGNTGLRVAGNRLVGGWLRVACG